MAFQAVDRPLSDEQLAFAQKQSTRAEVSRWSLSVEYHYSSFRGDVDGLLRRGYDVYPGVHELRHSGNQAASAGGMPFTDDVWAKYVDGEKLHWKRDPKEAAGF